MNILGIFLNILSILLLIIFFNKSKKISIITNLYKNKINDTPLVGGLGIYIYLTCVILIYYFTNFTFNENFLSIYILVTFIFLIGLLDDIFELNYLLRLILIYFFLLIFFIYEKELLINYLYFESFNITLDTSSFSLFLTPFFILLLINSLNMADGVNGNLSIISIIYFFLIFTTDNELNIFFLILIPSILIFLFFNFKNKTYLGDSGVYLISVLIAMYIINKYNLKNSELSCEQIFLIFLIPGIDMLRLFCTRIIKKKNPFKGDLNHLHHLLYNKFNLLNTLLIYSILISWPNLVYVYLESNVITLIILNIILYFFTLYSLKKLNKFFK